MQFKYQFIYSEFNDYILNEIDVIEIKTKRLIKGNMNTVHN